MTSINSAHEQHLTRLRSTSWRMQMLMLGFLPGVAIAGDTGQPLLLGVPIEFIFFSAMLAGIALFHRRSLAIALVGLAVLSTYKILFSPFAEGLGISGLMFHLAREWVLLANLLGLLLGFALLAKHFESSNIPARLPHFLPDGWQGGLFLLIAIFILSSFLDNIAAALIGGTIAKTVFRGKVHIGYLAGIVAASNAGGSGSVVGDTTTTMMWINGVDSLEVLEAYIAALAAIVVFGVPAAMQQHRHSPISHDAPADVLIDWGRVLVVVLMLVTAVGVNVAVSVWFSDAADRFPYIGASVWLVLLACAPLRPPAWEELPSAIRGSAFLLSLVLAASMMPVERLPDASWPVTLGLGFLSALFDNIPLTALALGQGGYDWGFLAYAVGFGGSMLWFGSSAGVALTNLFPEGKNALAWLRSGWHVALAYVVGFVVLLTVQGWHPHQTHEQRRVATPSSVARLNAGPP